MRTLSLLVLGVLLLGCTKTVGGTSGGMTSRFNDGHDTWHHTDNTTDKTKSASGDAEQTTFAEGLAAKGAGTVARWMAGAVFTELTGPVGGAIAKQVAGRAVSFIISESLNAPPYAQALGVLEPGPNDAVHGFVFHLDFPPDLAWMEDDKQSGDDWNGKRDLTLLVRAWGAYRVIRLTQDSNRCYGWCPCTPFLWPRGKSIRCAIYDADVMFNDGMVDFAIPDVNYYYELWVRDTKRNRSYRVGKLGFLSQSDVGIMREHYGHLRVQPGQHNVK